MNNFVDINIEFRVFDDFNGIDINIQGRDNPRTYLFLFKYKDRIIKEVNEFLKIHYFGEPLSSFFRFQLKSDIITRQIKDAILYGYQEEMRDINNMSDIEAQNTVGKLKLVRKLTQ
jgi:hypothetical protein